jgi:hypothetical protein
MNCEGCKRKWWWINLRYYLGISFVGLRKKMKKLVRIVGIQAQNLTRDLPNTKLISACQCRLFSTFSGTQSFIALSTKARHSSYHESYILPDLIFLITYLVQEHF